MPKEKLIAEFDEKKIDAIFAELNQSHLPGATVGIAIHGTPVYRKGFGLANMELPVTLTPSMRMRIGSTSKQFTAFTYMMLCEAGLAGIDDRLGKYLPELHRITHDVTLRQLMGNISGLRDVTDLMFQFSGVQGRPVTTDDLLSLYGKLDDVNATPGTNYIYNNGGWVIVGAVIERLTGKTLEEAMRQYVFEPIGMNDTLLRRWDSSFVPNSASPHAVDAAGRYVKTEPHGGIDFAGAGSIASTVDDMLRWMAHMDAPTVGSSATWKAMTTAQTLRNGVSTGYGLGLSTAIRYRGADTLQHAGGGFGSNAQMIKVPSAGLDVIVMVNRADAWGYVFAERILDACLPELEPVAKAAGDSPVNGLFRSPSTGQVIQLFENNGQQFGSFNFHEMPLENNGERVLRTLGGYSAWNYEVTLVGGREKPSSIRFSEFGNRDELFPVDRAEKTPIGSLAGRYRCEAIKADVIISATDGGAQMRSTGPVGTTAVHDVKCVTDGVWRTTPTDVNTVPPWGMITFEANGSGFGFTDILNRNVRFKRV